MAGRADCVSWNPTRRCNLTCPPEPPPALDGGRRSRTRDGEGAP